MAVRAWSWGRLSAGLESTPGHWLGKRGQTAKEKHSMKKSIILVFAAGTLFLAGCCTTHHSHASKWEYQKVWDFKTVQTLSAEGWTLDGFHSFDTSDSGTYYILKRRAQ